MTENEIHLSRIQLKQLMEADLQPFQCQRLEKGEKLNLETG
jgi:hypothetical protein